MTSNIVHSLRLGCLSLSLALGVGCSIGNEDTNTGTSTTEEQQATANPAPASNTEVPEGFGEAGATVATDGRDQLDFSGAIMLGPHKGVPVKSARITRNLFAASMSGGNVSFSMDNLGWPVPNAPVKGVNARTYIFWREGGQLLGGMFEWQRPGQTVKTLKNISNGYLDGRRPPRGAQVWFMLSNVAANERTNVVLSQNPW
jgi:hypothetical protein